MGSKQAPHSNESSKPTFVHIQRVAALNMLNSESLFGHTVTFSVQRASAPFSQLYINVIFVKNYVEVRFTSVLVFLRRSQCVELTAGKQRTNSEPCHSRWCLTK